MAEEPFKAALRKRLNNEGFEDRKLKEAIIKDAKMVWMNEI